MINPPIVDDSGYVIGAQDLNFLQISQGDITAWLAGERPLGHSSISYAAFIDGLWVAVRADGLDLNCIDIRLKGSAASFFAGLHKTMPKSRDEIVCLFRDLRGRLPALWEVEVIEERLFAVWPGNRRPLRRPFDSIHRLGIDHAASDFDLQLSSDVLVTRCEEAASHLGITVTREITFNNVYNFVRKDLVRAAARNLSAFASEMSDALQRDVALAVFASSGPPDVSTELGDLSSHFRATDWRIAPVYLPGESS